MTDIRRSILWIVFSVSLVMLWDAWNTHNGHPSMFAPAVPKPVAASGAAPANTAPSAAVTRMRGAAVSLSSVITSEYVVRPIIAK